MSAFRNLKVSKFRHAYGQPAKRENCYEGMRITTSAHDSLFCAVNPKFIAVVLEVAGGGAFQIVPIKMVGKIDYNYGRVKGHNGPINDLKWNPFDDNTIATCSDDCTVKLWLVPDEGVKKSNQEWLCQLTGHARRVGHIEWHPTVSNLLVSAGFDFKILLWNVNSAECLTIIDCHQDVIYSLSFNQNGSLLSTTSKDKLLRIINPRNGEIMQVYSVPSEFLLRAIKVLKFAIQQNVCHESSKTSKVVFLSGKNMLLTTGFSRTSHRQYAVWDQNNLTQPLIRSEIDSSAGILHPFYDCDLNILYLAGKGDGNIRFYEILNSLPYVQYLNEFQSRFPQRSLGVMPKRGLDANVCEIYRFYKVHTIQTILEPVSIIVPRKTEGLRTELYPPTATTIPSSTVEEWLAGIDRDPTRITIIDNFQNKRLQGNFNPSSTGTFGREPLLSPTSEMKFQFLSNTTKPNDRPSDHYSKPPLAPIKLPTSSLANRNPVLSPTFEAKFQFLTRITKPDYRSLAVNDVNLNEKRKDSADFSLCLPEKLKEKRLLDVGKEKKETTEETTSKVVESFDRGGGKENLSRIDVEEEESNKALLLNREVSEINNCRSSVTDSNNDRPTSNQDDTGRISVNIPNKIRRLCTQSPLSSNEEDNKSPLIENNNPSLRSSANLRTRSASPMSPVQIQSGLDESDSRRLVKPQPLHFNGTIGPKPSTKPGLITPGPIIRKTEVVSHRAKPFRISQSQPPTPRPDEYSSSNGLDKLESGIVDKIFSQQSKTVRELFEENYVKDKRIEQLENEVAKLSIKVEQLTDDLKQKQDDVDSLRYEIVWKDRRVVQLEQQLYKHIASVADAEVLSN